MNKHIIQINGKTYIFYLKNSVLTLFEYVNGTLEIVDIKNDKVAISGLLEIIKKEIEEKISKNEYKSLEEIKKDIDDKIGGINFMEAQNIMQSLNFENSKEYDEALKYLYNRFEDQNKEIELKKEIIEENIDINLKELFEKHGISEYEVGTNKSVITYMKNGMPHTLSYSNLDSNIYDVIIQSIEFDKMHSEEEIDAEIERVLETEKQFKFTENETVQTNELEDPMDEIKDYIRKEYNIQQIYGIKSGDTNVMDGALLIDVGNGWEPIFVTKENGVLKVTFGNEKEINEDGKVELNQTETGNKELKKDVNAFTKEEQLKEIYLKLQNGKQITDEDKEIIAFYRKDEYNFYQLSKEGQEICKEIFTITDDLEKENNPELNKEGNVKKLGEWPKPTPKTEENAFAYIGLVTFLSGLITGIFVYAFFKLFI